METDDTECNRLITLSQLKYVLCFNEQLV